jgi:hypothetical protein
MSVLWPTTGKIQNGCVGINLFYLIIFKKIYNHHQIKSKIKMDHQLLINKIQEMSTNDNSFLLYYTNNILYDRKRTPEERIFLEVIADGPADKWYLLFRDILNLDYRAPSCDFCDFYLSVIIGEKEYFIQRAKAELINKIREHSNM